MERTHDAFEVVSAASMWQKAATGNDEAIAFAREPGRVSISPVTVESDSKADPKPRAFDRPANTTTLMANGKSGMKAVEDFVSHHTVA